MSRKKNPNTKYTMHLHKQGKYRYAVTADAFYSAEGKHNSNIKIWGKLTEENVFIPNEHFLQMSSKKRRKFIFPEDWDSSRAVRKYTKKEETQTQTETETETT